MADNDPDQLPEDDTLTPPPSKTGGIPLGMQAGAKAGGDLEDLAREHERADDLNDAAVGDRTGSLTRVSGSEGDAIDGDPAGDVRAPIPPEAGGNAYDDEPDDRG